MSPRRRLRPVALLAAAAALLVAACSVERVRFTADDGDGGVDAAVDAPGGPLAILVSDTSLVVPEGQTRTFTVTLSAPPADAVLVTLELSDDTRLGATPTALLFGAADWATPQTVTLTGKQDVDTADESVTIILRSTAIDDDVTIDVTVDDDDGVALLLTPTALDVGEGATANISVRLTAQPLADVVVAVASVNPAVAMVAPAMLTFTADNWQLNQIVTVSGQQDANTTNDTTTIQFTAADLTTATVAVTVTDDDVLGIATSTSAVSLAEGGSTSFTVALTQMPPGNVTVNLASSSAAVATVSPASLSFTTSNWSSAQTVTVNAPHDDDVVAGAASVTVSAAGLASRTVTVGVVDDDTQSITAAPSPLTVAEGGTATLGVRLAFRPASDVTVTASSLATSVATVPATSLTFSPSNYSVIQSVVVTGVQDANAVDGSTTIRLEAPAAALIRDVPVTVTDDDTLGLETDVASLGVTEGATATFRVRLTAQPTSNLVVTIASNDTSAATATGSLSFTTSNWNTYQTVTVTGVQDSDLVGETVTLTLSASGVSNRTVTVNVTDDDTQIILVSSGTLSVTEGSTATVGVTLGFVPTASVTVSVASNATAVATVSPTTLTFMPGTYNTPQNLTITGVQDPDSANGAATISLTAAGATSASVAVTVIDDEVLALDVTPTARTITEGGNGTFQVRLTAQPAATTSVTITSPDPGAVTVSGSPLSFTTGDWNVYKTVTVNGVEDADAANESVNVTVASAGLASRTVTVTVTDNDVLGLEVTPTALTVAEGATGTFQVRLTAQPPGAVSVALASNDPSAVTTTPTSLSFSTSDWNSFKTVTVNAVDDPDAASETVTVAVSSAGMTTRNVTVTTTDNDTLGIQVSTTSVSITEGGSGTFQVRLTAQPPGTTSVTVTSPDTGAVSVSGSPLSFTTGDWNTYKTITVSGVQDPDSNNESVNVSVASSGLTTRTVTVSVSDDDVCGNGVCEGLEFCETCPQDCGFCNTCGDGLCEPFECCSLDCGGMACQ